MSIYNCLRRILFISFNTILLLQAHDLYHDGSLGLSVDLAIVRLIRLEREDHEVGNTIIHLF